MSVNTCYCSTQIDVNGEHFAFTFPQRTEARVLVSPYADPSLFDPANLLKKK